MTRATAIERKLRRAGLPTACAWRDWATGRYRIFSRNPSAERNTHAAMACVLVKQADLTPAAELVAQVQQLWCEADAA